MRRGEWRFGIAFSAVAIAQVLFGVWSGLWWLLLLLLWPAISVFVVSLGYFWGSALLFGKRPNGSRALAASIVLLPYTVVALVVWRIQSMVLREAAWQVVNDRLIVARRLLAHEMPDNVDMVLDLTSEFRDPATIRTQAGYRCLPVLDGGSISAEELIPALRELAPSEGKRVLIHCANGHGRTGMTSAAWLLLHGDARSAEEAVAMVQAVRPGVKLKAGQWEVVREVGKRAIS